MKESSERVTDLKSLITTHKSLLEANEINYKGHLKQLLPENVPGVQFERPTARNHLNKFVLPVAKMVLLNKTFEARTMTTKVFFQQQERS